MAIASHLVHQHLQTGEFAVEALVHKVVQRLQPTEAVKVFLNPEDWALLHQRQETKPLQSGGPSLQLLADPALQRGDCRAESGDVGLLWQLEDQLSEIRRHLLRSLSEAEVDRRGAVVGGTMLKRFPERRQTA
jgi:flagellar biosynthesis/type III secretory pathway protein FliH